MITTESGLIAALAAGQDITFSKAAATSVAGFWHSLWDRPGLPGAGSLTVGNTTAGVIVNDATAGTPPVNAFSGANLGYVGNFDCNSSVAGVARLYDRHYHVGSVLLTSLATTTLTGQPTLTRLPSGNTGGVGLELWLEINVAVSATATTVTVTYTNSAGTAGRTATLDTNVSGAPSGRMLPFRLQAGDVGIQKVESIVVGGTVATAGSVNVVILRRLVDHNILSANVSEARQDPFRTGLPIITTDSALSLMFLPTTTSTGQLTADINAING